LSLNDRTNESNWKQAEAFKTALYQDLVHAPHDELGNQWSSLELKFLVKKATGGKNPRWIDRRSGRFRPRTWPTASWKLFEKLIGNIVMRYARGAI
jgi:hypothetical protein